jgi:hypothetical protein
MKFNITESERNSIRTMHNNQKSFDLLIKESMNFLPTNIDSIVITDWVSPDDKYLILFDELFDLHSKTKLGDIWENFDNFKLFISHSFEVAKNVPHEIKESVSATLKSLVLTESMNDMTKIKPFLKQILREEEGFLNWIGSGIKNTANWAADKAKEFGKDIGDIASTGWEGLKKAGLAISTGDFSKLIDLLGKGMLFLARKIRALLYNPVGIVLDSILVATGIGKAFQWIPWAIVVALDIYEVSTGDYEDKQTPTWLRWLMIGADVLGLVFAGGLAGSARAAFSVFRGAKTEAEFAQIAAKNPNTIKWIEKIIGAFSKVPEYLGKAATYLKSTKLSKAVPWIESILGKVEGALANGTKSLQNITNIAKKAGTEGETIRIIQKNALVPKTVGQTVKTGAKAGLKTAGVVTAIDKSIKKGGQLYYGLSDAQMEKAEEDAALNNDLQATVANYEKQTGNKLLSGFDK